MLDGLDEVPWGELECAYGPATKIPQMLRGLAAGDPEVLDAMVVAEYGLVYCAGVYSATAAAVPFLVELAGVPQVPGRGLILFEVVSAVVCEGEAIRRPHGVRRRVDSLVDPLLALLDDDDRDVRAMAATALGHCDPPAVRAGGVLEAHRRTEPDPTVRATLIAGAAACDPTSTRDWVQDAYRDPAPNARAAAVYATAVNALLWTPLTTQTLLSCWDDGDPLPASWQWQWDLHWWLDSALGRLARDDRGEILTALAGSPVPGARQAAVDHLLTERHLEKAPG